MNMVNISYAVEMDDVPRVASLLSDEATLWVDQIRESLAMTDFESDNVVALQAKVHEIRSLLAKVDQRLADCYAITVGFNSAATAQDVAPQPTNEEPPAPITGLPEEQEQMAADLTDKIRKLQEAMHFDAMHNGGGGGE